MEQSNAQNRRGLVGRLLLLGMVAFLGLAVAESLFRYVVFPEYRALQQTVMTHHPVIGHFNRPDLEIRRYSPLNYDVINHTNSLGFRGLEEDMPKELAGVWILGDSNTFGAGVADDETYVDRQKTHGYWAANLSSEGLALEQQLLTLRHFRQLGYRPRAVLITLSLNSRIMDYGPYLDYFTKPLSGDGENAGGPGKTARATLLEQVDTLKELVPTDFMALRSRLIKSSAIYGWLKVGIMGVPALREWTKDVGLRADLDMQVKGSLDLRRPFDAGNPKLPLLRSTADFVGRFADYVREEVGVPFGVLVFPTYHQIYPEKFGAYLKREGITEEGLDPQNSRIAVLKALRERGIAALDVKSVFDYSGIGEVTFPDDAHPNAEALGALSKATAAFLGRELGVATDR